MLQNKILYTKEINSSKELFNYINRHSSIYQDVFYRGQSNTDSEWLITTTYLRWYQEKFIHTNIAINFIHNLDEINTNIDKKNEFYIKGAKKIIDIFVNEIGDWEELDRKQYIFLAQHYGLPTNLLDFTLNPFIALYFAFEQIPKDGYVSFYITTPYAMLNKTYQRLRLEYRSQPKFLEEFKNIVNDIDENDTSMTVPRLNENDISINIRLQNQEGVFVYFPYPFPYDKIMHQIEIDQPMGSWGSQYHLKINYKLKEEIEKLLTDRKITNEYLFQNEGFKVKDFEKLNNYFSDKAKATKEKIQNINIEELI